MVISGYGFPNIIKVGGTYYLYCQSLSAVGTGDMALYTAPDGVNFTQQSTTVLALGTAGAWDSTNIYSLVPVYVDGGGTWYFLYSGTHSTTLGLGLATSTDGKTLTKYAGNPVATGIWAATPLLINNIWYMWSGSSQPGQESGANFFDPVETVRSSSPDLISWTTKITHSLHRTQFDEGVNQANGASGFSYADAVIQVGNQTFMYYDGGPGDIVGGIWQINLAIAPAPPSSLILFGEDGTTPIASDSFPSSGALSPNWTVPTGAGVPKIVSAGAVEPTLLSTASYACYTGAGVVSSNQYSEVVLKTLTSNGADYAFPIVLCATNALTFYQAALTATLGGAATVTLGKMIAGSQTNFPATVRLTPQANDTIRLSVVFNSNGNPVLSLFQNGFLILQYVDESNSITTGYPGMALYASNVIAMSR